MYPVHLISSFVNKPPIIPLEDVILRFWILNNYGKRGRSPPSFLRNCLEATKTVGHICFKVVSWINSSGTSCKWWKGRGTKGRGLEYGEVRWQRLLIEDGGGDQVEEEEEGAGEEKGVGQQRRSRQRPQSGFRCSCNRWGRCWAVCHRSRVEKCWAASLWFLSNCRSRPTMVWLIRSRVRRFWVAASSLVKRLSTKEIWWKGRVWMAKVWADKLKWGSETRVVKVGASWFCWAMIRIYWRWRRVDSSSPQSNTNLISSNSCRISLASQMQSSDSQSKT